MQKDTMITTLILIGVLLLALFGSVSRLNNAYIPTPLDEATRLETATAKTATFAGTAFDLGVAPGNAGIGEPMAAVVNISAVDRTTGDETYTWQLKDSPDGTTWTAIGPSVESHVVGMLSVPGFRTQRYVAISVTMAGTTPSATWDAWLTTQGFPMT